MLQRFSLLPRPSSTGRLNHPHVNRSHVPSRPLHRFDPPRPEVIIGNNTAIFALLASLQKHTEKAHPDISVICPPFWLDKVDSSHKKLDWGQTIHGLPKYGRDLFKKIHPNYPDGRYIRWGEFQELRKLGLEILESKPNVKVYYGEPKIEFVNEKFAVDVLANEKVLTSLNFPKNSFFYNWYRMPIVHSYPVIQRSHTDLYTLPLAELPKKIVVLGHGLSVVWLAKHFPQIDIACIKRSGEKLPETPANRYVNTDRLKVYDIDEVDLRSSNEYPGQVFVVSRKNPDDYFFGDFYSAIGIRPVPEVTVAVPSSNKQLIPLVKSPDDWVAPKNIPLGSFMQSFTRWVEITDNLEWAHEPQAYHQEYFPVFFSKKMYRKGIHLPCKFFDRLEEKVKALENPLTEKQEIAFLINIFTETLKPTEIEIEIFTKELINMHRSREFEHLDAEVSASKSKLKP